MHYNVWLQVMLMNPGMNVYDIRKPCIGSLCYDFSRLDDYLAQPDVRKALGVGDRRHALPKRFILTYNICIVSTASELNASCS